MKELLKRLEELEAETNRLEALMDADPENEELENQWDAAYQQEFEVAEKIVAGITEISKGCIDHGTARMMLTTRRAQLVEIFNRAA